MARRGRFGRLPRSAPDLTSTLIALMREYQQQRDRNIQEAWETGGLFEGSKVTDGMVLDHWKMRRDGVSKDDPLWDTYNNSVKNMEFGISNSKQELLYAQGKVNDSTMANYYKGWAAKYPVDSEAYRRMMMLSAQYSERAKSLRSAGRRGASGRAVNNNIVKARSKTVAYTTIRDALVGMALSAGILNTETEDLLDLRAVEGDSAEFMRLINFLATSDSEEMVNARRDLTAYIQQNGDPNFNGDFSYESWMGLRGDASAGFNSILRIYQAAGLRGDSKAALKELQEFSKESLRFGLIDEVKGYEEARKRWTDVMTDPTSSLAEQWAATGDYREDVTGLYQKVRQERGGNVFLGSSVEGHLLSEVRALNGEKVSQPTLFDESRGQAATTKGDPTKYDTWTTADTIERMYADLNLLAGGTHVQVTVDRSGNPTIPGNGSMGVVDKATLGEGTGFLGGVMGVKTLTIPGPNGEVTTVPTDTFLTAIVGAPVYAQAVQIGPDGRPLAGVAVKPLAGKSDIVAYRIILPDGSEAYEYYDATGARRVSEVPPWAEGVNVMKRADGTMMVTIQVPVGQTTYDPGGLALSPQALTMGDELPTIHDSTMSAWMASGGKQSRGLPSTSNETLRAVADAESRGNPAEYARIITELDVQRAEYLTGMPDAASIYGSIQNRQEFEETFGRELGPAERAAAQELWAEGRRAMALANLPSGEQARERDRLRSQIAGGLYLDETGNFSYPGKATVPTKDAPDSIRSIIVPPSTVNPASFNSRGLGEFVRGETDGVLTGILGGASIRPPRSAIGQPLPLAISTPFFKPRPVQPYRPVTTPMNYWTPNIPTAPNVNFPNIPQPPRTGELEYEGPPPPLPALPEIDLTPRTGELEFG